MDYIGAVQGIPVCFDAKECAADTFALQNIHEHHNPKKALQIESFYVLRFWLSAKKLPVHQKKDSKTDL